MKIAIQAPATVDARSLLKAKEFSAVAVPEPRGPGHHAHILGWSVITLRTHLGHGKEDCDA
ncbi:hypothetical protein [Streptomyces lushanensis]|uniref:hypothetical protein n=1 Tax=Streptomyces lushanensis TaxID=1434255 RepID=UPI0008312A2C|nr:hypothetical protein [Streptomyces lushanensis]